MIVYVEDVNDEVPVFTQRQYNRLGLRETAGIGTSVVVVRATDRDTGRKLGLSLQKHSVWGESVEISRCTDPGLAGLKSACGMGSAPWLGSALVVPASSGSLIQPALWFLLLSQGTEVW